MSIMANTKQARKRVKQNEKRRLLRSSQRAMVRTYIKKVYAAIEAKDVAQATAAFQAMTPVIDRMAQKGVLHKNKAARHKSRLAKHLKALATAA